MAKKQHDPVDYDALSRAVEAGNYTARGPLENGATLRMGRPAKGAPSAGKSPNLSVRFPTQTRRTLKAIADKGGVKESEIVRRAVNEYIENHTGAGHTG